MWVVGITVIAICNQLQKVVIPIVNWPMGGTPVFRLEMERDD